MKEGGTENYFFNPSLEEGGRRIRRLGTGTGFAFAKLSEVLPRSERSLAPVRMTDFVGGVEPFKGSTNFEFMLSRLGLNKRENLRGGNLRGYDLVRHLSRPEARLEHEEMSALR